MTAPSETRGGESMSNVIRKASPAAKLFWWTMVLFTGGVWALVRGRPR